MTYTGFTVFSLELPAQHDEAQREREKTESQANVE